MYIHVYINRSRHFPILARWTCIVITEQVYRLTPSKHLSNMEGNGQGEDIVAAASPKYELVFEGITVSIGEKIILQNVSGMAQSGKLLAIMGQSGSFI